MDSRSWNQNVLLRGTSSETKVSSLLLWLSYLNSWPGDEEKHPSPDKAAEDCQGGPKERRRRLIGYYTYHPSAVEDEYFTYTCMFDKQTVIFSFTARFYCRDIFWLNFSHQLVQQSWRSNQPPRQSAKEVSKPQSPVSPLRDLPEISCSTEYTDLQLLVSHLQLPRTKSKCTAPAKQLLSRLEDKAFWVFQLLRFAYRAWEHPESCST